jgi:hypothetical protein
VVGSTLGVIGSTLGVIRSALGVIGCTLGVIGCTLGVIAHPTLFARVIGTRLLRKIYASTGLIITTVIHL